MSKLYDSTKLGGLELKNAIIMAPLTRCRAVNDRIPNDLMVEYYVQRATAGMIITEATVVSEDGVGYFNTPGIYNQEQVEGWKKITAAVNANGGKMVLQLWHCGRASHSSFLKGKLPVSASQIKIEGDQIHTLEGKKDYEIPRALETSEIPLLIDCYRKAAIRAKEAGFDGIEIHSANGYILDQFLQSKTNKRTDQYGGRVQNRMRLLLEVVDAIKESWPLSKVGVRFSPNGVFNDMGSKDFRETFIETAKAMEKLKMGYLHIMDGLGFGFHHLGEAMTLRDFRKVYSGSLIGNCGYDKSSGEKAVDEGIANAIAYGRPYMANPDLVKRFKMNLPLNELKGMETWYSPGAEGYTDYPFYSS